MKLTQKILHERMFNLEYWLNFNRGDEPYDKHVIDRIYNGFHHIVIEQSNDVIVVGSARECYDAMYYMIQGIKFGKGVM